MKIHQNAYQWLYSQLESWVIFIFFFMFLGFSVFYTKHILPNDQRKEERKTLKEKQITPLFIHT